MSTPPLAEDLAARVARHPIAADALLAAACFAVFTLPLLPTRGGEGPLWAVGVVGALAVVPLVWRRRWPVAVVLAVAAVEVAATLSAVRFTPFVSNAGPAVAVAVYTVAAYRDRRSSAPWSLLLVVACSAGALISYKLHAHQDQDFVQLLLAVPAWLVGDAVRTRREYRRELRRHTEQSAAERDARIRAEERLRLSRDVHDVVSHTLSMVAVRSGVARVLVDRDPDEARDALGAIETASRTALEELRAVLRSTRDTSTGAEPDEPGLSDLDRLAVTARAAGLTVELSVTTERFAPTLETSVYRIVQESLTNVVKHAGARAVHVEVQTSGDVLRVSVRDDGRGRAADAPDGVGSAGMRERVELFDGALSTGPGPDGGHHVVAVFPVTRSDGADG